MSKIEEFIKGHIRNDSNKNRGWHNRGVSIPTTYTPLVVPNVAREAAKIAREETIKEVCEWIKYNNENGGCLFDGWENDLKKHLEDKL